MVASLRQLWHTTIVANNMADAIIVVERDGSGVILLLTAASSAVGDAAEWCCFNSRGWEGCRASKAPKRGEKRRGGAADCSGGVVVVGVWEGALQSLLPQVFVAGLSRGGGAGSACNSAAKASLRR